MILQHHLHQQRVLTGNSMVSTLCKMVPMHRSLAVLILREFYPYLMDNMQVIPVQYLRIASGLIINLLNCMSCTCTKSSAIENPIFIQGDFNQLHQCYSCTCPFKQALTRGFLNPIGHDEFFKFEYTEEEIADIHEKLSNMHIQCNNVFINELIATELDYIKDLFSIEIFNFILGKDSLFEMESIRMIRIIHVYMYMLLVKRTFNVPADAVHIADIFTFYFHKTDPFYTHIATQLPFNKQKYDLLKQSDPLLLQQCEKHEKCRRLELQSWLNRCTTRLARYSLLISTILKKVYTPVYPFKCTCFNTNYHIHLEPLFDPYIEFTYYNSTMKIIKDIMLKVNHLSGQSENKVQLQFYIDSILPSFKTNSLQLNHPNQLLIRQGPLKRKLLDQVDTIHVVLFNNCLCFLRKKKNKFKITGWPLLLPLMQVNHHTLSLHSLVGASRWLQLARRNIDDKPFKKYHIMSKKSFKRSSSRSSMDRLNSSSTTNLTTIAATTPAEKPHKTNSMDLSRNSSKDDLVDDENSTISTTEEDLFEFKISYIGHRSESLTLIASSIADKKAWIDAIQQQQILLKQSYKQVVFYKQLEVSEIGIISSGTQHSNLIFFGTSLGLYVGVLKKRNNSEPLLHLTATTTDRSDSNSLWDCKEKELLHVVQLIEIEQVDQVEVIANQLIFMVDKTVFGVELERFDLSSTLNNIATPVVTTINDCKKISSHVSFFKTGMSGNRPLVCVVKSTSLSSTIKAYEPTENPTKQFNKFFKKDTNVKLYRELYIPSESTSIHFLKTKLCVGCTRGFEIVDLESLLTQGLLDPEDEDLGFAIKVDHLEPIALYRVYGLFLLCYNGYSYSCRICIFCR